MSARTFIVPAAILCVALLVAGCGGGGGDSQTSSTTPPVAAPSGEAQMPTGDSSGGGTAHSAEPPPTGGAAGSSGKSSKSGSGGGSTAAAPTRGERATKAIEQLLHTVTPETKGGGHSDKGGGALRGIISKARKEGIRVVTPGGSGGKSIKKVLQELGVGK